jgi:hypothetical protein
MGRPEIVCSFPYYLANCCARLRFQATQRATPVSKSQFLDRARYCGLSIRHRRMKRACENLFGTHEVRHFPRRSVTPGTSAMCGSAWRFGLVSEGLLARLLLFHVKKLVHFGNELHETPGILLLRSEFAELFPTFLLFTLHGCPSKGQIAVSLAKRSPLVQVQRLFNCRQMRPRLSCP